AADVAHARADRRPAQVPRLGTRPRATQIQEFGDAQETQTHPNDPGQLAAAWIAEAAWIGQPDAPSTADQRAASRRHHVAHPLRLRTIGKRERIPVTAAEDVHRGLVVAA